MRKKRFEMEVDTDSTITHDLLRSNIVVNLSQCYQ